MKNFKNHKKKQGNTTNRDGEEDLPRVIAFDDDSSDNEEHKSYNDISQEEENPPVVQQNTFGAKKLSL